MVEGGTPNTLLRRGLTRDSLTVGTELIVDGYQTKDHSLKRANGRDVTFTDGRKMFLGSSGTGAPRDGRDPTEPRRSGAAAGRLGEPDPASRGGNGEPERQRQQRDEPGHGSRVDSASPRHAPAHRQGKEHGEGQRRDLHPERLAVIALHRFRQEERRAGDDHHPDAAKEPRPGILRELGNRLTTQAQAEHPQIHDQQRSAQHAQPEQVHRLR